MDLSLATIQSSALLQQRLLSGKSAGWSLIICRHFKMDSKLRAQLQQACFELKSLGFVTLKYILRYEHLPSAEYLTTFGFVSIGGGML